MKNTFIKMKDILKNKQVSLPLVYCLFAAVSFCIYFNGLHNDFLYDDQFFIVQNLYLRSPAFLPRLLKMDVFHFAPAPSGYYRPIQMLSYGLDYFFWKLNPFGYHLTNVIIHSLNSFLVFVLVYLLFRGRLLALLSGMLFCVHPIHIGVVTVIGGRSNILEMMFVFLSLVSLMRYYVYKETRGYFLSLFLFIPAILSREGALLLPLFIVLCAAVLNVDKKRLAREILPFLAICGFYLLIRTQFMPSQRLRVLEAFSWQKLFTFFYLAQSYVSQLVLPSGLAAGMPCGKEALNMFLILLSLVFILGAAILAISKNKAAFFGSIFYLLGLLPLFNLIDNISFFGKILSEPYVYMASAGFFIIAAAMLTGFYARLPKIASAGMILVILFYASLTAANNMNYRDEATFYGYLLNVDKDNTIAHLNLGNIYLKRRMFEQAQKEARTVLEIEPDAWDAYLLLGNAAREEGDLEAAADMYNKALIFNPASYEAMNNLGLIYRVQGADDKAAEAFSKAIAMNPESVTAMNNMSDLLMAKRSYRQAMLLCARILELSPQDVGARVKIGIILAESGHLQKAESAFKEALRIDPGSVEALRNLGVLYANSGYLDKAISTWERAVLINPGDEDIRSNIERAKVLMNSSRKR